MNSFKEVKGCLIQKTLNGDFDVIAHGMDCFCTAPYGGIAKTFEKHFKISTCIFEEKKYKGKYNKLGNIQYKTVYINNNKFHLFDDKIKDVFDLDMENTKKLLVVNCYTQFNLGANAELVNLAMCLKKLNHMSKGLKVGLPLIGGGIGGLNKESVVKLMKNILIDCEPTLVLYDRQ